jgi:hypothetical protein
MPDYQSLTVEKLEELCGRFADVLRKIHKDDPQAYREALLKSLNRPKLPVADVLTAVRSNHKPEDAWNETLQICRRSAPAAPWDRLATPDFRRDIVQACAWLREELEQLGPVTGIYLGLDTLNMGDGDGPNIEIAGTTGCDPLTDSQDWVKGDLVYGGVHLIIGLFEMRQEYSQPQWRVRDETIAQGSAFSFADYVLFLAYSGIVLMHAFVRLRITRPTLPVWGFHDGDLFLLGRTVPEGFMTICQ